MKKNLIIFTLLTALLSTILTGAAFSAYPIYKVPIKIKTWKLALSLLNKQAMINIINEEREMGNTCSDGIFYAPDNSLFANNDLTIAAQKHAEEMARTGVFSHNNKDGLKPTDRIRNTGYLDNCRGWSTGENISWSSNGAIDQKNVVDRWLSSKKGHCQALMNGNYNEIGIGYAISDKGIYWVANFGRCD